MIGAESARERLCSDLDQLAMLDAIPIAKGVSAGKPGLLAERLPDGLKLRALTAHLDSRGDFTELFRDEWELGLRPSQWNLVRSEANVLRGVHVHRKHVDYLTMAAGEMVLGLHDLRPGSPTFRRSSLLRVQAQDPHLVVIPAGVAHGFYFPESASHIYGVSHGFDGTDEFG